MDKNTTDKLLSLLSYISIFWIVGLFVIKDNEIVRFHAKQGLILFLYNLIGNIIMFILVFDSIFFIINMLFSVSAFVFKVIGIYNAALLKKKKLPIIGNIKI